MKMNGKEFLINLKLNDSIFANNVYFCSEFVTASICRKDSERHSTHIGYLTCINHPSQDGTNPHWKVIIEINKSEIDKMKNTSLEQFSEALIQATPVKMPIWIELRESQSIAHSAIGDLWNDE